MLRCAEIEGYRSCRSVILDDLTPVTALIGPNGAGKTNVLTAIERAARTASVPGTSYDAFTWMAPGARIHVEFTCDERDYRYTIARSDDVSAIVSERLAERLLPDGDWAVRLERRGESVHLGADTGPHVGQAAAALPAMRAWLGRDHPQRDALDVAADFLSRVRYYPLERDTLLSAWPFVLKTSYDQWLAHLALGDTAGPTLVKVVHLKLAAPADGFETLRAILGPEGLGLLKDVRVGPAQAVNGVEVWGVDFEPTGLGRAVSYPDLAAGTRRIVDLVASLLVDRSSVLLIEHPENDVHAELIHKLVGLLHVFADSATILMSTHSTTVMDQLEPEECRLVTLKSGVTNVRSLTAEERAGARAYLDDAGSLSEFLATAEQV